MAFRLENAEAVRVEVAARLAHVRQLLAEPLVKIEERYPHRSDHPLLEVLSATERWIHSPRLQTARIEGHYVEAMALAPLIEARHGDPGLPELRASMVDPSQYLHGVAVLGTAFAMQSLRGVRSILLVTQNPTAAGRIPDIKVRMDDGNRFYIEAKAPRSLRGLHRKVRSKLARNVVNRAVSDAAFVRGGQLPKDSPGIVAVASFGLTNSDFGSLLAASRAVLEDRGPEIPHVMGILLVNFYRAVRPLGSTGSASPSGERIAQHTVQLAFGSHRELVPSGGYSGTFRINSVDAFEPARDGFDLSVPHYRAARDCPQ